MKKERRKKEKKEEKEEEGSLMSTEATGAKIKVCKKSLKNVLLCDMHWNPLTSLRPVKPTLLTALVGSCCENAVEQANPEAQGRQHQVSLHTPSL